MAMASPASQQQQQQQPLLYNDLRHALHSLYNSSSGATAHIHQAQAHDFLMHLQGRNVRRKLQSIQQSIKDATKDEPLKEEEVMADELVGSTWWACVAVLLTRDASASEKLFCSQTMLHRIRRLKLEEAIDVELEQSQQSSTLDYFHYMVHHRSDVAPLFHGISQIQDEHAWKGQSMLITTAWIMVEQASFSIDHALQTTLASTMAAIALRLAYTPQSMIAAAASPNTNTTSCTTSICDFVLSSLTAMTAPFVVVCIALGAIPDTILGSPGGARGKLSVDPRCIVLAKNELAMSGVQSLWNSLQRGHVDHEEAHAAMLSTCERWAKFLPLPMEFIQQTVPLAREYVSASHAEDSSCQRAALSYLIALYESGSWTVEKILSHSLGLASEQLTHASTKKKQSSKSKKRHKERLEDSTTDTSLHQAEMECRHRGDTCIQATWIVWEALDALARISLQREEAEGEGPVVCLTACANACLPHLVKYGGAESQPLLLSIMTAFQQVCSHSNPNVRGLTYEPLFTLHQTLIKTNDGHQMNEMESLVADHFYQCCMRLATGCGYPRNYFQWLTRNNDDELENERDDVRGVLRALSGSGEDSYVKPPFPSTQILHRLIKACSEEIFKHSSGLPPETVVHALSALAKPINHLSEAYVRGEAPSNAAETLAMLLTSLRFTADRINAVFGSLPAGECIAVSRLVTMATSSCAPTFRLLHQKAVMPGRTQMDSELFLLIEQTLKSTMKTGLLSVVHLPELVAESTLKETQYDIRGAMRGPGGEDHVGVLVFMRLADESDDMAKLLTHVGCNEGSSLLLDLCNLHDQLKEKENQRPPGVLHGIGVTPKSRRILLSTISKLVKLSDGPDKDHAQRMLHGLFFAIVSSIVGAKSMLSSMDARTMYQLAEATFDLAAFGTTSVCSLFAPLNGAADDQMRQDCIHVLVEAGSYGYKLDTLNQETNDVLIQWGRCRASLMCLIKTMSNPDFTPLGAEAVTSWILSECEAIERHCNAGPSASSSIFVDNVICEDVLQAGAFVKKIGDLLIPARQDGKSTILLPNIVAVLNQIGTPVLRTLVNECPEWTHPGIIDPRNSLCEAWMLTMESMVSFLPRLDRSLQETIGRLLVDTCSAATLLLLYPTPTMKVDKKGMSMDGYQTIAMLDFFHGAYCLGSEMLHVVASNVASQVTVVDTGQESVLNGRAIVGASLFRATSGGLPPWAMDHIPQVFEGLFAAHNRDLGSFQQFLSSSMVVRLATKELIAGKFIDTMSDTNKSAFVTSSMEEISKDNWRRFKVILKMACGGKKKQAGFNLKPSPTNWECDRV